MEELLIQSLREKVASTDEELQVCRSYFKPKHLKKRQFLLQEGKVTNYLAFVGQGALYSYSVDAKGAQRVIQFGGSRTCTVFLHRSLPSYTSRYWKMPACCSSIGSTTSNCWRRCLSMKLTSGCCTRTLTWPCSGGWKAPLA